MHYMVRRQHIGCSDQLDTLALEAGRVYSQTVTTFWRTVRRKDIWLKPSSMMRMVNEGNLHAHTIDATVQAFYASLKSWRARRKTDPNAHPPRRRRKFFRVEYKTSAISLKNGKLQLANGRGNKPLMVAWAHPRPRTITIHWTGEQYEAIACYEQPQLSQALGDEVAGIDLGEIHMAVSHDGEQTIILNGRYLRSVRQYQNKLKALLSAKIEHTKPGSRRRSKLVRSKRRQLAHVKNQLRDIEHKQTTKLVSALHQAGVQTLAIGDVKDIRHELDYGHAANQKLHQWTAGKTRFYLSYKATRLGMKTVMVDEHCTSRTCPACGNVKTSGVTGRNYLCAPCGFKLHRDAVGAINIRAKYLCCGTVVGPMARPIGVRYHV